MRKLLVAVFALGLVAAMKAPSFAAFTTQGTSVMTAAASFTAAGTVSYSFVLKNRLDDSATGQIWWDVSKISLGVTQWQVADAYMVLATTMSHSTGGIQIYTNNAASGVRPRYVGDQNPAGLLLVASNSASTTTVTLPMCWRAVTSSTNTLTIVQGGPNNNLYSNELGGAQGGLGYPCFLYFLDKGSSSFLPNAGNAIYQEVIDGTFGYQYSVNNFGAPGTESLIMYFGANFTGATTPNTYKTSTVTLEAYHE